MYRRLYSWNSEHLIGQCPHGTAGQIQLPTRNVLILPVLDYDLRTRRSEVEAA